MSETEPSIDPVPVTKELPVFNGNQDDGDDIPHDSSELVNGINKPVMDVNGINGDHGEEINGTPVNGGSENPTGINGDNDEPEEQADENVDDKKEEEEEEDLMGGDDLPPPPPMMDSQADEGGNEDEEEREEEKREEEEQTADPCGEDTSVDPIADSSVDPVFESSVDPEVVDDQCADDNDELMNVSDTEEANDCGQGNLSSLEPPPIVVEDMSEEELVSDGDLEGEVNVDDLRSGPGPVSPELTGYDEGQLVDIGDSVDPVPEQADDNVPQEIKDLVDDEDEDTQAPPSEAEIAAETEQAVEASHAVEPEPISETPEEPATMEPEQSVPEEQTAPDSEPEAQPVIGFPEPAVVVDNKPAEGEVDDSPPPPPPPLVDETPVPPPPLDDSIPLRRVSGGSSPSKESTQSLESPTPSPMNQNVAVVPPQPELVKDEPVSQVAEAEPVATEITEVKQAETQPVAPVAPVQPVAMVAPQVQTEASEDASPAASPPSSPSIGSGGEPATSPQVSQKINKKNFKNKIKFGADLVEGSIKQLNFLKAVNNNPGLYEEWLYKKAIRRYEAFWLPLAAQHKKECLVAPLDIEWLWHCHMLAPLAYEADCKAQVNLVVEHKLMSEKDRTKGLEKSRKYWHTKYPNEPFEIELVYREKVVEEVENTEEPKGEETPASVEAEKGDNAEVKEEEKKEETNGEKQIKQ